MLLKVAVAAYSVLSRYAGAHGMHPMAGGMGRVALDGAADYADLRRRTYGVELAPLPESLATPEEPRRAAAP